MKDHFGPAHTLPFFFIHADLLSIIAAPLTGDKSTPLSPIFAQRRIFLWIGKEYSQARPESTEIILSLGIN
jgi:hypothetical protein